MKALVNISRRILWVAVALTLLTPSSLAFTSLPPPTSPQHKRGFVVSFPLLMPIHHENQKKKKKTSQLHYRRRDFDPRFDRQEDDWRHFTDASGNLIRRAGEAVVDTVKAGGSALGNMVKGGADRIKDSLFEREQRRMEDQRRTMAAEMRGRDMPRNNNNNMSPRDIMEKQRMEEARRGAVSRMETQRIHDEIASHEFRPRSLLSSLEGPLPPPPPPPSREEGGPPDEEFIPGRRGLIEREEVARQAGLREQQRMEMMEAQQQRILEEEEEEELEMEIERRERAMSRGHPLFPNRNNPRLVDRQDEAQFGRIFGEGLFTPENNDVDRTMDQAAAFLRHDDTALDFLGPNLRWQRPFSQSTRTNTVNGLTTSQTEAQFEIWGSQGEGIATVLVVDGILESLDLEVEGRVYRYHDLPRLPRGPWNHCHNGEEEDDGDRRVEILEGLRRRPSMGRPNILDAEIMDNDAA